MGDGSVGLNPSQPTYVFGDTVFVTATADPGWSFDSWSGDLTGSENPDTLIVGGNASITATFTQDLYTITTNAVGSGTVGLNPSQPTYVFGDTVFVTATADPGWSFDSWSGDLTGSENPDTLIVSGNASITATFTQDLYTITTNTVGNGSVGLNPAQPTYVFGDTVFVTATADPGWSFDSWSGDLTGSENPDTLIVSGNASITATFTQDLYTITTSTVGNGAVGLNPAQPTYVFGDTVVATATAAPGWNFVSWSGDLTGSENPDTLIVGGNAAITATFTQGLYTITTNAVGSGTVGLNPAQATYAFGDTVFVTATADPGWSFGSWSGDLTGSENPDTLIMGGNASITATFTQDLYTITTNAVGSGTVGLNPAQPTYVFGDTVFVTATADSGWSFTAWSGDLTGSENPDTLIVGGNASITATFTEGLFTCEDYESGFTLGQMVGSNANWFDGGNGPVVLGGIGVNGSVGLSDGTNIFTWTSEGFSWTDGDFEWVVFQMDFESNSEGIGNTFNGDRVGWMISNNNSSSDNIFGVQFDDPDNKIQAYWDGVGGPDRRPLITTWSPKRDTWYRLWVKITKLTALSARLDVTVHELASDGTVAVADVAGGTITDTSLLGPDAPDTKYFTASQMWPGFKNSATPPTDGAADNACYAVSKLLPTGVGDDPLPLRTALLQNAPNPFNPTTTISYTLVNRGWVSLRVYDVRGRLVRTLVDMQKEPGTHAERWDGRSDRGEVLATGVYFYRLRAGETVLTRKAVLLK